MILSVLFIVSLWACKKNDDPIENNIYEFPHDILGSWEVIDANSKVKYWEFNDNGNIYKLWKAKMDENMVDIDTMTIVDSILKINGFVCQYSIKDDTLSLSYNNDNFKLKKSTGISYENWIHKIDITEAFQINNANLIISLAWTGSKMWALDTVCNNPTELNKYYRAYLMDIDLNQGVTLKRKWSTTNIYPCAITCYNDTLLMSISREFDYYNAVSGSFIWNNPNIFIDYISGLCSNNNQLFIYELPPYGRSFDIGSVNNIGAVYDVYDIAYNNSYLWFVQKNNRLLKYDLNVKSVIKTYKLDTNTSSEILCLEFTDKDLWVVDNKNRFYKISISDL